MILNTLDTMSKVPPKITCSPEVRVELERRATSRTEAIRTVDRARMMLGCLNGQPVHVVAKDCRTRENTVIKWRDRFVAHGLPGLEDATRPGARKVYDDAFLRRVLATLEQPPPIGQAVWDGPAVARAVQGSVHAVWRILRKEGICLQQQRSWCVSTDPHFAVKAAEIVGLYLIHPKTP